jgi:acyl-coenzyme A thioesterase PaaI-like protein
MSAITDAADGVGARNGHSQCLLCGSLNPRSLRLAFQPLPNGEVRASFQAQPELQGYEGILHGGIIASVLDAAMTHCLFHHDVQGVTGDLQVRFVQSVACEAVLEIRARLLHARPPLYRLKAELCRDEQILAWAKATFMQRRRP